MFNSWCVSAVFASPDRDNLSKDNSSEDNLASAKTTAINKDSSEKKKRAWIPQTKQKGIFFGYLAEYSLEKKAVYLVPHGHSKPKEQFFVDDQTTFSGFEHGTSLEDLPQGARIALRYFRADELKLADRIILLKPGQTITERMVRSWLRGKKKNKVAEQKEEKQGH